MASRIQEWVAEQWFNKQPGGTPITAERLNRIEAQVEGVTQDLNTADEVLATKAELNAAIAGIDINDPDFDAFIAALDPTMRDVVLGVGAYDLTYAALLDLIEIHNVSLFRGRWSSYDVVTAYDFAGGLPAGMTKFGDATRVSTVTSTVGTGQPTPSLIALAPSGGLVNADAGVSVTVPAGVTAIGVWTILTAGSPTSGESTVRYAKNGAGVVTIRDGYPASNSWSQTFIPVAEGDVVDVYIHDVANSGIKGYFGGYELLTSAVPYMVGQCVTHLGKLWRSTIDNNSSTPGSDANWVSVLTDPIPATTDIKNIVKITQAAYDALATKVATTLYVIVG